MSIESVKKTFDKAHLIVEEHTTTGSTSKTARPRQAAFVELRATSDASLSGLKQISQFRSRFRSERLPKQNNAGD